MVCEKEMVSPRGRHTAVPAHRIGMRLHRRSKARARAPADSISQYQDAPLERHAIAMLFADNLPIHGAKHTVTSIHLIVHLVASFAFAA